MNLADDNDAPSAMPSSVSAPPASGSPGQRASGSWPARLGTRLLDALWLRDAEGWARRLEEGARQILFAQVTRARQKLESARLLWAHEQYVEGLRLAEESVVEALRAAEQAAPILATSPSSPPGTAVRPLWADVLAALGAAGDEIDEAMMAAGGFVGSRPSWNGDLRPENRRYFRNAIRTTEAALEHLQPLVLRPRRIVATRWLRVLAAIAVVAGVIITIVSIRNAIEVRASGTFNDLQYDARKAIDGKPTTEWLLPSNAGGWIEVAFRPRTIKTVKLLNARNAPFFDRATRDFRIEGYLDKKVVHTSKHSFAKFEENPQWMILPLPSVRVDTVRIVVENHHKTGAGLAELAYE